MLPKNKRDNAKRDDSNFPAQDIPLHKVLTLTQLRNDFHDHVNGMRKIWWFFCLSLVLDPFIIIMLSESFLLPAKEQLIWFWIVCFFGLLVFYSRESAISRIFSLGSLLDKLQRKAGKYSILIALFALLIVGGDHLLRDGSSYAILFALLTSLLYLPGLVGSIRKAQSKRLHLLKNDLERYSQAKRTLSAGYLLLLSLLRLTLFLSLTLVLTLGSFDTRVLFLFAWVWMLLYFISTFPYSETLFRPCSHCGNAIIPLDGLRTCASCPTLELLSLETDKNKALSALSDEKLSKLIKISRKNES